MKANYKCSNWLLLSSLVLMLIQYSCQQEDLLIYEAKKSDVVIYKNWFGGYKIERQ